MSSTEKNTPNTLRLWVQGISFCLLGAAFIIFPERILQVIGFVLAIVSLLIGLSGTGLYIRRHKQATPLRWYWLVVGVLAIVMGVCLLVLDEFLPLLLALTAGIWILIRSSQVIGWALTIRSFGLAEWIWLALAASLMIIFSIIFLNWPGQMVRSSVILTGIASSLIGIYHLLLLWKGAAPGIATQNDI